MEVVGMIKGLTSDFTFSKNGLPYSNLAFAIVQQAVSDTKRAVDVKSPNERSDRQLDELSKFFKSAWCVELLGSFPVTGAEIFNILTRDYGAR